MSRVTRRQPVVRFGPDHRAQPRAVDHVAVEEPLEIRIAGAPFQITMRTPGHDIDLVHGLLFAEQVISAAEDVSTIRYCDGTGPDGLNTYNVVDVELAAGVPPPDPGLTRNVLTTSACGVCGAQTIDTVMDRMSPLSTRTRFEAAVVAAAPAALRPAQRVFDRTGGAHAVGLVTAAGDPVCVREDVGRHNAADKVVGWAVRAGGAPATGMVMAVTARASFELVHKAVGVGVEVLAAVSAPSSLAIDLADRAGLTLAAFVRDGSMNVYTHADRLR